MLWVCIWDNLWLKCTASMMHLGLYHSEVYNFCMHYVRTTKSWRNLCDAAMQTFAPVSSVGEFVKPLFCYWIARYKISFLLVKVSKWKKQNLFSVNPACTSFLRYTNVWQQGGEMLDLWSQHISGVGNKISKSKQSRRECGDCLKQSITEWWNYWTRY